MRHRRAALLLACAIAACDDGPGEAGMAPLAGASLAFDTVATGLDFPVRVTAPAGDTRLFVVERGGTVRILRRGTPAPRPFLDIGARVSGEGEQGLMDLAFAPDYAASGRFFVTYSDVDGDFVLAAYRVSADADVAEAGSRIELLRVPHAEPTHYGGSLAFGPDGHLYVGMGDGGNSGVIAPDGQRLGSLLGKILRLDVTAPVGYAAPPDNPFAGDAEGRDEIWSWGLRNPWRIAFDRRTGDLWIADVGEDRAEELNVARAAEGAGRGTNFGWPLAEGDDCFRGADCGAVAWQRPLATYGHADGCAVTGGALYRGRRAAGLDGAYVYGDFCGGWVRALRADSTGAVEQTERTFLGDAAFVTSVGEDAAGELYVTTRDGVVARLAGLRP